MHLLTPRAIGTAAVAALVLVSGAGVTLQPASAAAGVSLYPSDRLTVADPAQKTGRRMALPTAGCKQVTICGAIARINELDGFDLDPRLALTFPRTVSVAKVVASTTLVPVGGGPTLGIDRVVYDQPGGTVYAHPQRQLLPGTTYRLAVSGAQGLPAGQTTFTTSSAPDGLLDLRRQLDSGAAYRAAGIPDGARGLRVDAVVPTAGTTFSYQRDDGRGPLVDTAVPNLANGTVVFGSYLAPSWLLPNRTIEQVPTSAAGPTARRADRLPFLLVLPSGQRPAGGWPTAVFGHGFTRSAADVLVASLRTSTEGLATVATDVVGHGGGPRSTWTFTRDGRSTTVPAYARGVDVNGDGSIGSTEGSSTLATGPAAAVGSRDGLRQTAADNMALVRAVQRGLVLSGQPQLRTTGVTYFGQSFGGIYGTMLSGADPQVARSVLNVAGGPISDIARLSPVFRPLITQALSTAGLLNSKDADVGFFVESLPLRGEPPVLAPAPGSLAIQQFLAYTNWLTRAGSPETYAPLVRTDDVLLQVAFGDQTVPNPTSFTLLTAGRLAGRTALFRNDRTGTADTNPHAFLLDLLTFGGATLQAQGQVVDFLLRDKVTDPDGAGNVWQIPARVELLQPLNYTSPAFPGG